MIRLPWRRDGAWLVLDLDDAVTLRAAIAALFHR